MNRLSKLSAIVGATSLDLATQAQAALPAGATALFDSIEADGALVIAAAFGVAAVITAGWVVFDMVKRGVRKGAK